jgi:hypothetical protein
MDLNDVIQYENETTNIDFKSTQYSKKNQESFLKDVMAMANSLDGAVGLVIIGVKLYPGGARIFHPIHPEEFVDDGIYQQWVRENIEPEIKFTYKPWTHSEGLLGIFEIGPCTNAPYMMRRASGSLIKGECWIRKGSHQDRVTRQDLCQIFDRRSSRFNGTLKVGFDSSYRDSIELCSIVKVERPSTRARKEIEEILSRRRHERQQKVIENSLEALDGGIPVDIQRQLDSIWFPGMAYQHMTNTRLERELEEVLAVHKKDDQYCLLEETAHKIQLFMHNDSSQYLEDATLRMTLKKQGLFIPKEVLLPPVKPGLIPHAPRSRRETTLKYPAVTYDDCTIRLQASIGDIRHQLPVPAFGEPFRLVIGASLAATTIELDWMVHAKNLPQPLSGRLFILVRDN